MNKKILLLAGIATCFIPAAADAHGNHYSAEKNFINEAIKGDNSEMMLGHIAAEHGDSEGTREFGRTLEIDHRQAKHLAAEVAKRLGVAVTDDIAPEARREWHKLEHLSGRAFDREFASYMVRDHKEDISKFRKEAKAGHADTSPLARDTLPTLHKHLDIAERLKKSS